MNGLFQQLANGLGQIAGILTLLACAVLYMRLRSTWIMIALIGEAGSLACRLVLMLSPQTFRDMQFLSVLWPLNACIFAIGLLGYAWFESGNRPAAAPAPETQP